MSKYITSAFELTFNQINSYSKQWSYFYDINSFCTILNNQPVIDTLDKLNGKRKTISPFCFDFPTLYTKMPYDMLLKVFIELIDLCMF